MCPLALPLAAGFRVSRWGKQPLLAVWASSPWAMCPLNEYPRRLSSSGTRGSLDSWSGCRASLMQIVPGKGKFMGICKCSLHMKGGLFMSCPTGPSHWTRSGVPSASSSGTDLARGLGCHARLGPVSRGGERLLSAWRGGSPSGQEAGGSEREDEIRGSRLEMDGSRGECLAHLLMSWPHFMARVCLFQGWRCGGHLALGLTVCWRQAEHAAMKRGSLGAQGTKESLPGPTGSTVARSYYTYIV